MGPGLTESVLLGLTGGCGGCRTKGLVAGGNGKPEQKQHHQGFNMSALEILECMSTLDCSLSIPKTSLFTSRADEACNIFSS